MSNDIDPELQDAIRRFQIRPQQQDPDSDTPHTDDATPGMTGAAHFDGDSLNVVVYGLQQTVERQGFMLNMVLDHLDRLLKDNDTAGIGTVQPESQQQAGGQIRLSYPLPTGLGDLLVTVREGENHFTITWRAPNKERVHHRFAYTEANMSGDEVAPNSSPP